MPNLTISKTTAASLMALRQQYYQTLTSPLDGMWEQFTLAADQYLIEKADGTPIAYGAVNPEHKILQFFSVLPALATSAFATLIQELDLSGATVATSDGTFLAFCMDHQQSTTVNALMYHSADTLAAAPTFPQETQFRLIAANELGAAIEFAFCALGADRGWLNEYYTTLIERQELFGLWQADSLIAAGERRISDTQKPYADVGMVVAKDWRRKGLATAILQQLALLCRGEGLRAICSTESGNIGAQKAIENAGFISTQRILDISF